MPDAQVARFTAALAGLAGFVVAVAAGLTAGNEAEAILVRGLVVLVVGAVVGYAVGSVAAHVVRTETRKIDAAAEAAMAAEMESSATMSQASLESSRIASEAGESVTGSGALSTGSPRI